MVPCHLHMSHLDLLDLLLVLPMCTACPMPDNNSSSIALLVNVHIHTA